LTARRNSCRLRQRRKPRQPVEQREIGLFKVAMTDGPAQARERPGLGLHISLPASPQPLTQPPRRARRQPTEHGDGRERKQGKDPVIADGIDERAPFPVCRDVLARTAGRRILGHMQRDRGGQSVFDPLRADIPPVERNLNIMPSRAMRSMFGVR
jgi:hypothetical protein